MCLCVANPMVGKCPLPFLFPCPFPLSASVCTPAAISILDPNFLLNFSREMHDISPKSASPIRDHERRSGRLRNSPLEQLRSNVKVNVVPFKVVGTESTDDC